MQNGSVRKGVQAVKLPNNQRPDRRVHRVVQKGDTLYAYCIHSWKRESTAREHMQKAMKKSPAMEWNTVATISGDTYTYLGKIVLDQIAAL